MSSSTLPFEELAHHVENIVSGPGWAENTSEVVTSLALVGMILLVGSEAIVRNVFGSSLQITDEIGGYLLVAVTFLSMSVSEAHGAFHRVELVQARLGVRVRIWLQIVFDLCSLAVSVLIAWQLMRLTLNSWNSGDVAPTPLQTPLWLPQMVMGVGLVLLCVALLRSAVAKYRRLRGEAEA